MSDSELREQKLYDPKTGTTTTFKVRDITQRVKREWPPKEKPPAQKQKEGSQTKS